MLPPASQRPPCLAAEFLVSAAAPSQFPAPGLPEVALLGRSNSGKSSLLNRWLGRKGLAKVGSTPGRTRLINFFRVTWAKDASPFLLADLPGYGYAAAPRDMVAGWRDLVAAYLEGRRPIRLALLIMDIRRRVQGEETALVQWLAGLAIPPLVVASKADKLGQGETSRALAALAKAFGAPLAHAPLAFSSVTGAGRDKLIETLIDSGLLAGGGE